jgi:hypothetical protein
MAKNSGKHWNPQEISKIRSLARVNTPTGVIGLKLGRTKEAVQAKASEQGISLRPINKSPYNRRSKS